MGTTAARDPRGARRRHAGRPRSCAACCPAAPRPTSCCRSTSTCRWTSTPSPRRGSRLGTGTMIVLDDQTCPVRHGAQPGAVLRPESCGWCTPCREGLPWVGEAAARRSRTGEGQPGDLEMLERTDRAARARATPSARWRPGAMEPLQSALKLLPRRLRARHHGASTRCPWRNDADGDASIIDNKPLRGRRRARTSCRPACRWASTCPTSAGTRRCGSVGACRQCAVKQFQDDEDTQRPDRHGLHDARLPTACASRSTTPRRGLPRERHRVADDQPPARLPGLRRGRRVPPAGHDGDDRPHLPPLPLHQAHPPQPGPRARSSTTR